MKNLSGQRLPRHIAIIMDGNGRWARRRGLPRSFGHRQGVQALRRVVEACGEIGVKFLTVFTFSTENWQRPRKEIDNLMKLLARAVDEQRADLMKNNVRVRVIGRFQELPEPVRNKLAALIDETKQNTGLTLTLALNYGGRAEIVDACRQALMLQEKKKITAAELTEERFATLLYDPLLPDVDLLIRTAGEQRISNFLLWQTTYAELYFTETLWPDFGRKQLLAAIEEFSKRQRRFGRVVEE